MYLFDGEELLLENTTFTLEPGQQEQVIWEVEAWTLGRLGLVVQIGDDPLLIPVPLADVADADVDGTSSNSELGLNVLLVLLAAGAVIASMLIRKQRMKSLYDEYEDFEEEDFPPPRPQGLDDIDQEE